MIDITKKMMPVTMVAVKITFSAPRFVRYVSLDTPADNPPLPFCNNINPIKAIAIMSSKIRSAVFILFSLKSILTHSPVSRYRAGLNFE